MELPADPLGAFWGGGYDPLSTPLVCFLSPDLLGRSFTHAKLNLGYCALVCSPPFDIPIVLLAVEDGVVGFPQFISGGHH